MCADVHRCAEFVVFCNTVVCDVAVMLLQLLWTELYLYVRRKEKILVLWKPLWKSLSLSDTSDHQAAFRYVMSPSWLEVLFTLTDVILSGLILEEFFFSSPSHVKLVFIVEWFTDKPKVRYNNRMPCTRQKHTDVFDVGTARWSADEHLAAICALLISYCKGVLTHTQHAQNVMDGGLLASRISAGRSEEIMHYVITPAGQQNTCRRNFLNSICCNGFSTTCRTWLELIYHQNFLCVCHV